MDLLKIRDLIDSADKKLVSAFEDRMNLALEVAKFKMENNKEILDVKREEEVIKKNIAGLKNHEYDEYVKSLYEYLMVLSRDFQREILVTDETTYKDVLGELPSNDSLDGVVYYQGIEGSYSEEGVIQYFGEDKERIPLNTFSEVFDQVINNPGSFGVLPIENTTSGGILDVERLLEEKDVFVVGETRVKIEHVLMGIGTIEDLRDIYSHNQGFIQCSKYLEGQNWNLRPYFNTAISAKKVKELNDKTIGAIGSSRAANVYDLKILNSDIQYNQENYTRFIVIRNALNIDDRNNKISISFNLLHSSGSLFNIIKSIKENNLNMFKIESKPIVGEPFEYVFYIDFNGNLNHKKVLRALLEIKENSMNFKFQGNYRESKWGINE